VSAGTCTPPADRSQTYTRGWEDSSQAVSAAHVSAPHRGRAVVGEQKFRLTVTGGCSMAKVALVRATSAMVARKLSARPSSAAGSVSSMVARQRCSASGS
jgi:hypothetical protein